MKRIGRGTTCLLAVAMLVGGILSFAGATDPESVIARVLNDYMLETEAGELIEVADTEMGEDLLRHVGKMADVFGKITGGKRNPRLGKKVSSASGIKENRMIRVEYYTLIEE